jgi:hypothetical protein
MTAEREVGVRRSRRAVGVQSVVRALLLGGLALLYLPTVTAAGPLLRPAHAGQAARSGTTVGPHKGILPPKNPSKSLAPNPDFLVSPSCEGAKDTTACNDVVIKATTNARKVLEALGPMSFSLSAYERLTGVQQLFVTADLERVERGLPPMLEITKSLDALAQAGADANTDPDIGKVYGKALPGGGIVVGVGGNFAGGFENPLGSDYGWMYDDGLDSPNKGCTTKTSPQCWGHRDNILFTWVSKAKCPSGPLEQVMGAGYLVGKKAKYGDSETQVLAGVCGKAPTDAVFTWAKAESLLHIT